MIALNSTRSLEIILAGAVTTNQLPFTATYVDHTPNTPPTIPVTAVTPNDGQTNNTTAVTVVPAPAVGTQRTIKHVNVYNADTAQATLTIRLNNGGTFRTQIIVILRPGDRLEYEDGAGFRIMGADGAVRAPGTVPTASYGLKNLLINGAFNINQRVFAGGALAAGIYGHDRWKADAGGANYSVSGDTVTLTSGTLVQVIESPGLANQPVTISVEDPTATLNINIEGITGSITTGSGRRSFSLTIPGGSTGNITVKLTGPTVSFKRIQLEVGSFATTYETRLLVFETALCQRYYEKSYNQTVAPGTLTNTGLTQFYLSGLPSNLRRGGAMTFFRVQKRTAAAVTLYSPTTGATGVVRSFTSGVDVAASAGTAGAESFAATTSADFPIATECNFGYQWTADAEI